MSGFLINHYKNRTRYYTIAIKKSDGTGEILSSSDTVRFKIGTNGATPDLDIDSSDTLPGGSTITFTNGASSVTLKICQEDVDSLTPGAYDAEVSIVDDSDSELVKHAQYGVFFLHNTQLGDIGIEESSSSSTSSASSASSSSNS